MRRMLLSSALLFCLVGMLLMPAASAEVQGNSQVSLRWSFSPMKGRPGRGVTATIKVSNNNVSLIAVSQMFIEFDWRPGLQRYYWNDLSYSDAAKKIEKGHTSSYTISFDVDNSIPVGIYNYSIQISYNIQVVTANTSSVVSPANLFNTNTYSFAVVSSAEANVNFDILCIPVAIIACCVVAFIVWKWNERRVRADKPKGDRKKKQR